MTTICTQFHRYLACFSNSRVVADAESVDCELPLFEQLTYDDVRETKLVKHHSAVVLEWRRPRAQKEVRPHTLPQLVALYGAQTPQSAAATYLTEKA